MPKARKLAYQTLTPLGILFLRSPPDDPLPVADFRTVGKATPRKPSPELLATVTAMLMRQDWLSEELKREEIPPLKYVQSHDVQVSSPESVAEGMREAFQLDCGWQAGMNYAAAREHLYASMANAGILPVINGIVGNNTHRPLDPAGFRGFALIDNRAPLVFVNGNDAHAAQIFTLANEAAHVLIGKSGVSLCSPLEKTQAVEAFCNKAAASFLVPAELLSKQWSCLPEDEARIGKIAKSFCVSKHVIAVRARDLRLMTHRQFRDFCAEYRQSECAGCSPDRIRAPQGNGGGQPRSIGSRARAASCLPSLRAWLRACSAMLAERYAAAQRADEAASGLRIAGSRLAEVSGLRVQATAIGLTRADSSAATHRASSGRPAPRCSCGCACWRRRNAASLFAALRARQDSASPQRVLERCYAMVEKPDGSSGATYVQRAGGLRAGDRTRLIFADGSAAAQVASVDLEQGFAPDGSKGG